MWIPFLLVHEIISAICALPGRFAKLSKLDEGGALWRLRENWCKKNGLNPLEFLGIGLHGDGVPCGKKGSAQVFSWNILGSGSVERLLFSVIHKEYCCKCGCRGRCTLDAMLRVFVWSLKFLCAGVNPSMRHDGRPCQKSDKTQSGRAGKTLNAKGLLLEERGDWAWRKELFDFPSWSSTLICWMCQAGEEGVPWSDFSLKAAWRRCRLSPSAFFARQRQMGVTPSPLFEAPGFSISMCVIDHLHALDLGVSQTALGNVFWDAIMTFSLFSASNVKAKSAQLFLRIKKIL